MYTNRTLLSVGAEGIRYHINTAFMVCLEIDYFCHFYSMKFSGLTFYCLLQG